MRLFVLKMLSFNDGNPSGDDYTYDANGNLTADNNKGITKIKYNHLNLPTSITSRYTGTIDYIYDANGMKLAKEFSQRIGTTTTEYAGNYVYEKFRNGASKLQFFNQPEGYIEPKNENNLSEGFQYIYQYKDHLGNIRLSYADQNGDGTVNKNEIREEKNYYPFGLTHKGYNTTIRGRKHKYGYNGKEEQKELDLQWLDYHARNYDTALGRWMNLDPLAEKYYAKNPYNYTLNNPIAFTDPDGKDVYFVIYTGASGDAYDAAQTRKKEIESSKGFNSKKDHVYFLEVSDLGKLKDQVESSVADAEENGYGKTVEASFFGHAAGDGPVGAEETSANSLSDVTGNNSPFDGDQKQLSPSGWQEINFNFAEDRSIACFNGCNSHEFANKFLNYQNVTFTGGKSGRTGGSYNFSGNFSATWLNVFGSNVYQVSAGDDGKVLPTIIFSRDSPKQTYNGSVLRYNDSEGNSIPYRESEIGIYGNPSVSKDSKVVISGSKK